MNYSGPSAKAHSTGVAVALFVERDGRFLFMKRLGAAGAGTWAIPGGGVEFNEEPRDAAVRELFEETGIHVKELQFLSYSNDVMDKENLHYVTLLYYTDNFGGEPKIMEPNKCSEMDWFGLDELPQPLFSVLTTKLQDAALIQQLNEHLKNHK